MGTGKTTLGRALASRLPLTFIDLDDEVEAELGCTAAAAFAAGRAADFRAAESRAVAKVAALSDVIVACGGGTPCYGNNLDAMLAAGTVVCLQADVERLRIRLEAAPGKRPLVAGLSGKALADRIAALQAERAPHYSRAHYFFDSSHLDTPEEIDSTCKLFIANLDTWQHPHPSNKPC